MLTLLEFLASNDGGLRLSEIASATNMNSSAVSRFLTTLKNCGYITQEENNKKYYLTYKLCRVANSKISRINIIKSSHEYMKDISDKFNCPVYLSIEYGDKILYVNALRPRIENEKDYSHVNFIESLYCTGAGKIFLANRTSAEIQDYLLKTPLEKRSEKTIISPLELLKELREISAKGYAYDNEELTKGYMCIAVPIYDYSGRMACCISAQNPIELMTDEFKESLLLQLQKSCEEISVSLGWIKQK